MATATRADVAADDLRHALERLERPRTSSTVRATLEARARRAALDVLRLPGIDRELRKMAVDVIARRSR